MPANEEEKTTAEIMAERRDNWKVARSMLRESDLQYGVDDVLSLADWLTVHLGSDDDA